MSGKRSVRVATIISLALVTAALAGNAFARPARLRAGPPLPLPAYDGQPYGLRSGGQGPLNASGSYGAMLEGRNPVGSTGF
jgi:hypothetical protein